MLAPLGIDTFVCNALSLDSQVTRNSLLGNSIKNRRCFCRRRHCCIPCRTSGLIIMRQVHDHIPRHSRSVLQGIFSILDQVLLADAAAILQRPVSYRVPVRAIEMDPAISTLPGYCNGSTAWLLQQLNSKKTCSSHMTWLSTSIRLGRAAYSYTPFSPCAQCPCGHVARRQQWPPALSTGCAPHDRWRHGW